jgi:hypothetical protein
MWISTAPCFCCHLDLSDLDADRTDMAATLFIRLSTIYFEPSAPNKQRNSASHVLALFNG